VVPRALSAGGAAPPGLSAVPKPFDQVRPLLADLTRLVSSDG
jgi:hypothetical protein